MELTELRGVGAALKKKLGLLGIAQVEDLLFHLPLRYEDRTVVHDLSAAVEGQAVQCCAQVLGSQIRFGRRRSLVVSLEDDVGALNLRLFHFSSAQQAAFAVGAWVRVFGDVRRSGGYLEMVHPEYRVGSHDELMRAPVDHLTPVYPSTAGLSQNKLRQLMDQALLLMDRLVPDFVADLAAMDLHQALHIIHCPPPDQIEQVEAARQRLIFEELLAHRLAMLNMRSNKRRHRAPPIQPAPLAEQLREQLPFTMTAAQQRVVGEISADMAQNSPMLRLLQGDVGAGKTCVAAMAAAHVMGHGLRVILMAPTEILARQHEKTLNQWFEPLGIPVVLHMGGQGELKLPAVGPVLIVGTHALFHGEPEYGAVGLVVVDEQHRFGVDQRLGLKNLAAQGDCHPHQLIMTATPIPRTLAQTFFADLDFSSIDELPPGREPVVTVALAQHRRHEVIERLKVACEAGRQAYWVSPVIEASEWAEAAEDIHAELTDALPKLKVGLVHGRLKPRVKQAVMAAFSAGEVQILVATTVIEVGVDVSNASVMVIDNAERMGLAQLHQLRGRVGRGGVASHCVLMYRPPLSESGRARLEALRHEHNGFRLAERDLELRGAGELLGTRQSGLSEFRIADPQRDAGCLPEIRRVAEEVFEHRAQVVGPLLQRWLPAAERYADA
ncbi:MAG: ATP-dependent DNA helicase RecG [Oceanococcus sp.]